MIRNLNIQSPHISLNKNRGVLVIEISKNGNFFNIGNIGNNGITKTRKVVLPRVAELVLRLVSRGHFLFGLN